MLSISQHCLQCFLTVKQAKPADSCWNQLLNVVTSCLLSHDHLWNFSVWLLIRSSQSPLWVGAATPMFLSIFGGWFESLAEGQREQSNQIETALETTDCLHPFQKPSRLREKAQDYLKENHLALSFSPLSSRLCFTVNGTREWQIMVE